jgi:flavin-binding protein dodecin
MSERVYKLTEIVGTSNGSIEKAIEVALERAKKSLRNVRWFEVVTTRGYAHPDRGIEYQVTLKVGFQLDD